MWRGSVVCLESRAMKNEHDAPNGEARVHAVLHTARLADEQQVSEVAALFRRSRDLNPLLGIGGALLFDGERLAQLLIGAQAVLAERLRMLAAESGHVDVRLLFNGEVDASAVTSQSWRAGWAPPDALAVLDSNPQPRGPEALQTFLALLPDCDLL